jgi:hypothetical protein
MVTWCTRRCLVRTGPPRRKELIVATGPVISCRRSVGTLRGGSCGSVDDGPLAVDEGLEVGAALAENVRGVL